MISWFLMWLRFCCEDDSCLFSVLLIWCMCVLSVFRLSGFCFCRCLVRLVFCFWVRFGSISVWFCWCVWLR